MDLKLQVECNTQIKAIKMRIRREETMAKHS